MQQWSPEERAINDAMQLVERRGADVRLTDAVVLLAKAQGRVADFIDGVKPESTASNPASGLVPALSPQEPSEEDELWSALSMFLGADYLVGVSGKVGWDTDEARITYLAAKRLAKRIETKYNENGMRRNVLGKAYDAERAEIK